MMARSWTRIHRFLLATLLCYQALTSLPKCEGGRSLTIISGIFGFGNDNTNSDPNPNDHPVPHQSTPQSFGRSASASLPPHLRNRDPQYPNANLPPPPPPRIHADVGNETIQSQESRRPPPPPPPLPQWGMSPAQQQQQQGWMRTSPPYEDQWQYANADDSANNNYLKYELEESLSREGDLIGQLDNLTAAVVIMEQREELHMRQLDVLTERVMDVEAQAANDRNLMLSYQANCTELGKSLAVLQDELDTWQQRCSEFAERHDADQEKLQELKRRIKEKETEVEEFAIAIENVRLAEKRREHTQSRRKSNRGGVFSWFLSFFVSTDGDYDDAMREEAYEMAKSTLLRALQAERGNVHELEAAVMSLQQNNSAISEMVESRDSIIDELNNRIAVFEEDKVVLKAALRQLQKEIKDEAPRAQKLMDDLANAEQEIKRLRSELNSVIQTHQQEILQLQQTISSKQQAISETESNLTAIGTYVDKLEERLTSFAVTRRDMEERERKCKEIEEIAVVIEREKKMLQEQVDEFTKREEEVKKVLEELAVERTTLQKENRKLYTEREFRIAEQEQLQAKCASLENTTKTLHHELEEWKSRTDNILPELQAAKKANAELMNKLDLLERLQEELEPIKQRCTTLEEDLRKADENNEAAEAEKKRLQELNLQLSMKLEELEKLTSRVSEKEQQAKSSAQPRQIPFRALRKQFSKATGIHGLLTPPSQKKEASRQGGMIPPRKDGGKVQRKETVVKPNVMPATRGPENVIPPPPPQRTTPPMPSKETSTSVSSDVDDKLLD